MYFPTLSASGFVLARTRLPRASLRLATRPRPFPRASAAEADPQAQLGAPAAVGEDRLPPWREKSLKKRANIIEMTVPSWKDAMKPGSDARINPENVNRSLRSAEEMGPSLLEMKRGSLSS
jgi:hypothetical protein